MNLAVSVWIKLIMLLCLPIEHTVLIIGINQSWSLHIIFILIRFLYHGGAVSQSNLTILYNFQLWLKPPQLFNSRKKLDMDTTTVTLQQIHLDKEIYKNNSSFCLASCIDRMGHTYLEFSKTHPRHVESSSHFISL